MEYKPNTSLKIAFRILCLAFVSFAICIFTFIRQIPDYPSTTSTVALVIAILLILVGLRFYLSTIRTSVIIDAHSLTLTRFFRSRSISLREIKAYRLGPYNTFYLLQNGQGRSLRIPRALQRKDLLTWIMERYPDIDRQQSAQVTAALLANEELGATPAERQTTLEKAASLQTNLVILAGAILLWSYLYPKPFGLLMLILFAAPFVPIYLTWRSKGLFKLYRSRRSPHPSLRLSMLIPVISSMCILERYHVYEFPAAAWIILLSFTCLLTILFFSICRKAIAGSRQKILIGCCATIVTLGYSFLLILFTNCYFDGSVPETSQVTVLNKRISRGKTNSYYLGLSPWGRFAAGDELNVPRSFFVKVSPGDRLEIDLGSGAWNIPWYRVRRESPEDE